MANHYDTLNVATNATPKEIKKSFYTLSKANHPDLHPNDPTASQRFVKISEAYATLGSAEKRQRYDRDFLRSSQSSGGGGGGGGGGPAYSGSHSSHMASGPGGRSPSGLSRRRTQFRGPPPSFYRNGGWGDQGAKRQEASEKASHTHEAQGRAASNANSPGGGMGPGGFTQGFADDVPHFDAQGHFKTHEQIQRERVERNRARARIKRKQGASYDDVGGGNTVFNFFVVGGVLGGIAAITGLFSASDGRHPAPGKKRLEVGGA